jgi:uncharacterized YigZ family protein
MSYRAARSRARFEQEIERSRFIGIAAPVSSLEEVEAELERIREEFPDATHHTWAYLLGDPQGSPKMRFDDDGEPSGTAGRPILNVLQRRRVGDALLVVVRYFGGVKLGAGGLVRAYSGTASQLLDRVELAAASPRFPLSIRLDYGDERNARRILGRLGIAVVSADYSREVTLAVRVSEDERKAALEEISELTGGRARFGPEGDAI